MASLTMVAEVIVMVAVVAAASFISSSSLLSLQHLQGAQLQRMASVKEGIEVRVKVTFATAEQGSTFAKAWVKNVGSAAIPRSLIEQSDVFFGPSGAFAYIPYASGSPPSWNYTICNDLDSDGRWDPGETIELTIEWVEALDPGDYYLKFVAYSGASDEYEFSI